MSRDPRLIRADARRNRDAVLRAAVEVLRTDPGASMDAIARAAGVARRTAFRSFATREELVREAHLTTLRRARESLAAAAAADAEHRFDAAVAAALSIGDDYWLLINVPPTTTDPAIRAELDLIMSLMQDTVQLAQQHDDVRRDLPLDLLSLLLVQVIATVLETAPALSPAEQRDLVRRTYLHGVATK